MPTLQGIMPGRVDPFSIINSDGWRGYNGLVDIGYGHYRVDHSRDEFVNGPIHIQRHQRLLGMCQSQAHQVQGHSQTHLSSTPEGNENGAIITGLKTSTKPCYDTSGKSNQIGMTLNMKYSSIFASFAALTVLSACAEASSRVQSDTEQFEPKAEPKTMVAAAVSGPQAPYMSDAPDGLETAIFAGGCFWCVEKDFEALPGVIEVLSGYTGGQVDEPSYKQVSYTETGHYEAAEVLFDPEQISYRELVDFYWTTVDPTDATGQFCDKGSSYRTAVFATAEQLPTATASLTDVQASKPFSEAIVTPVIPAVTFYDAEDYHQDYYKKNPIRYRTYRAACRRDSTVRKLWGDAAHGGK